MVDIVFKKATVGVGAFVSGIDLGGKFNEEEKVKLKEGLLQYQVLFFRDQDISAQNQLDLALLFGDPVSHPAYPHVEGFPEINILINDKENPSKIEKWHTDMSIMECPPMGSILKADTIPPCGGDTLFSSMSAAYQGLSDKMQQFLSGLTATHDFTYGFRESLEEPGGRIRLADAIRSFPPIEHPVIRTHPETGQKGIFVNGLFTRCIKGMSDKESSAILSMLYEHVTEPEYTCRFCWEENSIAFWDNRITQHKPVNDYFPDYRKMRRVTIKGDRPV